MMMIIILIIISIQLHFNMCKEVGINLQYEHRYVPKTVETIHEGKVTVLWNQQCEPTELFLTINLTS